MYTSSKLFIQDKSVLSWNYVVHPLKQQEHTQKERRCKDSDCHAIVFQRREGTDFYFSLLGCKRRNAVYTKEQHKIICSQEKLAFNSLVKKAMCLFLNT